MTTKRKDGKKSNKKADPEMVSVVKTLMERGVPVAIISDLYGISPSTAYMWSYNERQSSTPKAPMQKALMDATAKFKSLLDNSNAISA